MAPIAKGKHTRYDQIVKSPNNKRHYRGVILHNKFKVLLISDPTTDKSAASLDVNVGYTSDPKEYPGLAHFYERMLHYGTSKYPEMNDYYHYLSRYGGYGNSATYPDHTHYYFDVHPDKLNGALDRFSQFFIAPLFKESAIEVEMNSTEHEKHSADYIQRFYQLERHCADPSYVRSKIRSEKKPNPTEVRNELLNFHKNYYSASVMTLSVLGKENLDDLEKMVVGMFSDVENREVHAPFKVEHYSTKWYVVPVKDVRYLNIMFPIPDQHEYYRYAPVHYYVYLVRHAGKGSLISALREKGWCNSLVAEKRYSGQGFDYFYVHVDLTEDGIKHTDDIITMFYQYINMLKKEGPMKQIYEEYRDVANVNFQYEEKYSPRYHVRSTARNLQEYPIEEVLAAPYQFSEWNPEKIKEFAQYFVPEKMKVYVVGNTYESVTDSVEPYYGTHYKMEKFSDEAIKKWNNAGYYESFHFPEKNEFVPTKFDIKPKEQVGKYPTIIEDTPYMRVWYKQDDEYSVPKASMYFDFVSPYAYVDPVSSNLTYLFVELFKDSFKNYAYYAQTAGLHWEMSYHKYGFRMALTGYDHKMDFLLEKIFDRLVNFKVDQKRFEILKEYYTRHLKNYEAEQPNKHAAYYLDVLLSEQVWVNHELVDAIQVITAEKVQQFIQQFMSHMHIEYLIYGNVTKSEAVKIAKSLENKITVFKYSTPLMPYHMLLHRVFRVSEGHHYMYENEYKNHYKCSSTQIYYQTGLQSTNNNVLLELFTQIIYEPFYYTMHTKEQFGHTVHSRNYRKNGVQGLRIAVQSDKHPEYVEKRIDDFMDSMREYIKTMSDEEFNSYKESLATRRLEKPKMMREQSRNYWREITMQQYNFDRANDEVAYLKTVTRDQMIHFYERVFHSTSKHQRKLSVYMVPSEYGESAYSEVASRKHKTARKAEEGPTKIKDVLYFKSTHSLYPLVEPYNHVPFKGTQQRSEI